MTMSEAWVDFIAGWASGAMGVLTCQPVDTVLTRLQAGPAVVVGGGGADAAAATVTVTQQAKGLVSHFGISSLWRGSSAMISAIPFQNAMLMGGYGLGKQYHSLNNNNNNNDSTTNLYASVFVGGCTGGIVQSFLMSPVELVKVHQQITPGVAARVVLRRDLLLLKGGSNNTFFRGLNATLLRDGIPHGVWFVSYEWCKNTMTPPLQGVTGAEQVTIPLVSGAFAATVAWAVGYPFDIIKTRIQSSATPKGIYKTGMEILQESNGNWRGLYRGFSLKLLRAVPASMIGFTTYEFVAARLRPPSTSPSLSTSSTSSST